MHSHNEALGKGQIQSNASKYSNKRENDRCCLLDLRVVRCLHSSELLLRVCVDVTEMLYHSRSSKEIRTAGSTSGVEMLVHSRCILMHQ